MNEHILEHLYGEGTTGAKGTLSNSEFADGALNNYFDLKKREMHEHLPLTYSLILTQALLPWQHHPYAVQS